MFWSFVRDNTLTKLLFCLNQYGVHRMLTIVEGGWIGTNQNQSLLIEKIIKDILENGKTAVLAFKKKLKNDFFSEQFKLNDAESDDFENLPFK